MKLIGILKSFRLSLQTRNCNQSPRLNSVAAILLAVCLWSICFMVPVVEAQAGFVGVIGCGAACVASPTPTTISISVATPQAYSGTTAVETINVTDSVGSYPDGTVSCATNGNSQTYTGALVNGVATWGITGLPIGTYGLTCTYSGSAGLSPSASQVVEQEIIATPLPTWTSGGSLAAPRLGHTATLLNNGSILLAGGVNNTPFCSYANRTCIPGSTQSTAEVYDPTSLTTTTTGNNMQSERQGATASLLADGEVLVAGGGYPTFHGSFPAFVLNNSTDIYDPNANQFIPGPNMIYSRCGAVSVTLLDGTILIVGGSSGEPAEIYNPQTNSFSATGSPVVSRIIGLTATLLQNGKVLITGGSTNLGCVYSADQVAPQDIQATAELYEPSTGKFTATTGSMNVSRMGHTATLLSSGNVLIVGGTSDQQNGLSSAELYDPVADTFTLTGSLNNARANHTASLLANGLILIAGGNNPVGGTGGAQTALSSAEVYDPVAAVFSNTTPLNTARIAPTAVVLPGGSVFETGGAVPGSPAVLSTVESYAPPTVSGWVNPKYVILGVSYAPPGSQSSVSYANSTTQGNTTTISNAFSNGSSLAVSIQNTIKGAAFVAKGTLKYTASSSSAYTQNSMSSNAVTLTKMSSLAEAPQPVLDPNNPVNHDYDIIYLWLNPLALFTADPSHPGPVVWNGYAFDPNDITGQDIYPVLVGQLIGDIPLDPGTANELSRNWVANQTFAPGDGPGLSAQDLLTVAQADPFVNCIYDNATKAYTSCSFAQNNTAGGNFGPPPPPSSADGRFTQVVDPISGYPLPPFPYGPGIPKQTYTDSTTNTKVTTQQSGHTFTQTFGIDVNFQVGANFGFFASNLMVDTKYMQTLTWTHTYQEALTHTTMNTSTVTIASPTCSGTSCSTYAGPPEFLLYQDNLYGTFMFYPVH